LQIDESTTNELDLLDPCFYSMTGRPMDNSTEYINNGFCVKELLKSLQSKISTSEKNEKCIDEQRFFDQYNYTLVNNFTTVDYRYLLVELFVGLNEVLVAGSAFS
jgi:hypothetical protein